MQATYSPGDGLVVGAGSRWVLLDVDPGPEAVERLWALLTGPRPDGADVLEAASAAVGPDGSLVLVDLTPGAETSVARGGARHTSLGGVHTLTLGDPAPGPGRPLVGGVVAGSAVVLRPAATAPAPAPTPPPVAPGRPTPSPAAATGPLIDGIPPELLVARPPAPAAPPAPVPPRPAPAPTPPAAPPDQPAGADHDGHTTYRPGPPRPGPLPPATGPASEPVEAPFDPHAVAAPGAHLQHSTSETVLAVHCPSGHVTAAYHPRCRVCDEPVPDQEPHRMPRPRLGTLHLPDGERVPLDRGVVLGRQPSPVPGGPQWPHLVRLPPEASYVSRSHLSIELDGWLVLATDLGSRGGTTLRTAGRPPQRIRGHESWIWEPGQVLDLADSYEIVYEVDR